jgi:hypothetical protein
MSVHYFYNVNKNYPNANLMSFHWNQTALRETSAKKWEVWKEYAIVIKKPTFLFNPDSLITNSFPHFMPSPGPWAHVVERAQALECQSESGQHRCSVVCLGHINFSEPQCLYGY